MRHVVMVGLPTIALVLTGCSASPTPTPSTSLPTAEEILVKARDAMSGVQSYRFQGNLDIDSGEGVQKVRLTGKWAAPDRTYTRTEILGEESGFEQISVGGRLFVRASDADGPWMQQGFRGSDRVLSWSPSSLVVIPDGVELQALEEDMVSGESVFHLTYTRKQEMSQPTSSGANGPPDLSHYVNLFELFISTEDYLVLQMITEDKFISRITTNEDGAESEDLVVTQRTNLKHYGYDEPVTIELPEAGGG